jgi:glycosyltransferase involved in cell wall biosynthesis
MKPPSAKPRSVLHLARDSDTSGFFPQLARWHDERYRMVFGTLYPTAPWLTECMTSKGVSSFHLRCGGRLGLPLAVLRLTRMLRREQIDVVHGHLFEPGLVGLVAASLARTPIRVLTRHYSDYHTRIYRDWHVRADRLSTWLSHQVVAVSQHTAEHLQQVEGAPAAKVRVVYNGIDFDRVNPSRPDARTRVRAAEGLADTHVILAAGRLHPEKGYEFLLDAVRILKTKLKHPFVLLIAGDGPFEMQYRERTRRLGCERLVRFMGFRKDLPELMLASDVFVLPSLAEAFGLVLVEALYLGVPVVATRVGGIPEIVDHGSDGVLVPPADSTALAAAVMDLLSNDVDRRRLAGAGRAKVIERFSFQRMVRAYEALYDELSLSRIHP